MTTGIYSGDLKMASLLKVALEHNANDNPQEQEWIAFDLE